MSSQEQTPKVSIIIAIVTATTGLGVALFNNWDKLFSKSESSENAESFLIDGQRITAHFDVREENENPINGAEVRFVFEGAPIFKFTDHNGYTSIELPKRDGIEVTLRKQGFITQRLNVNLIADPSTVKTVYLTKESLQNELNTGNVISQNSTSNTPSSQTSPQPSPPIIEEQTFQSELVWRSETNKTRLPHLDRVCFGQPLLENVETVFGYNTPPFSGTIYVQSPKQGGCVPGEILRGSFDLAGNAGNCIGDVVITWENTNRSHIKWTISNLGASCPVGTRNWEIPVYPVQK